MKTHESSSIVSSRADGIILVAFWAHSMSYNTQTWNRMFNIKHNYKYNDYPNWLTPTTFYAISVIGSICLIINNFSSKFYSKINPVLCLICSISLTIYYIFVGVTYSQQKYAWNKSVNSGLNNSENNHYDYDVDYWAKPVSVNDYFGSSSVSWYDDSWMAWKDQTNGSIECMAQLRTYDTNYTSYITMYDDGPPCNCFTILGAVPRMGISIKDF